MAKWEWKTIESSPRKLAGSFPAYSAAEQENLSQRSRVRGLSLRHTNTHHGHDIMNDLPRSFVNELTVALGISSSL